MYGVKGSWAGQTFALATTSDSGGRKSRIRRSKEERKAMVESFIKRYQNSNDGNFPSLNLTHKEVGGSFYTVREIVREIIQENKVLGPARYGSEVQHIDNIAACYPLGSIAAEPQGHLFPTAHELNVVSNHQEKGSVELLIDSSFNCQDLDSVQCSSEHQNAAIGEHPDELACKKSGNENLVVCHHEHASLNATLNDKGQCLCEDQTNCGSRYVDEIQTIEISEETDKLLSEVSPLHETLEAEYEPKLIGASNGKLTNITEKVAVETFPLRPAVSDGLDSASADSGNLNGAMNNSETKASSGSLGNDKNYSLVSASDQVKTTGTNGSGSSMLGKGPDTVTEHVDDNGKVIQHREVNLTIKALDTLDSSRIKKDTSVMHDHGNPIATHNGVALKTAEQNGHQCMDAPKGTSYIEKNNGTSSKSDDKEPSLLVANVNDIRKDNKAVAGSSPPLDRINLQSWERTASKQQPNPLLAVFKAFVDAFVKFWSQ